MSWKYSDRSWATLEELLLAVDKSEGQVSFSNLWLRIFQTVPKDEMLQKDPREECTAASIQSQSQNNEEPESNMETDRPQHTSILIDRILETVNDNNLDGDTMFDLMNSEDFSAICFELAERSSPEVVYEICSAMCQVPSPPVEAVQTFCTSFLSRCLQKESSSRRCENSLRMFIAKHPKEACERIIVPLMSAPTPIVSLSAVAVLNPDQKSYTLEKFLDGEDINVGEWVLSIVHTLYEGIPEELFRRSSERLVQFFDVNCEKFSKSTAFGKLLYLFLKKSSPKKDLPIRQLENILFCNRSPFKNACLNILKGTQDKS